MVELNHRGEARELAFLQCRVFRHSWEDFIPMDRAGRREAGWGTRFSLLCVRCGSERHDTIDSVGTLSTRQYVYPDGYKMVKDELPSLADLRLELLARRRREANARVAARSQR